MNGSSEQVDAVTDLVSPRSPLEMGEVIEYSDSDYEEEEEASSDVDCEETDEETEEEMYQDNDDAYYDTDEEDMVENGEYEEAELRMRRVAKAERSLKEFFEVKLEQRSRVLKTCQETVELLENERRILKEENESLRAEHKISSGMCQLQEENEHLKRRLKVALEQNCRLLSEQSRREEPKVEECVTCMGIRFTHLGNQVVKQETFDVDSLLKQNEEFMRMKAQLELKVKDLSCLMDEKKVLEDGNAEHERTIDELREAIKKFAPMVEDEVRKNADQQQMNDQLVKRTHQLEEQLRRASECAGSLVFAGEQNLMERARGMPGLFKRPPVLITLSTTRE